MKLSDFESIIKEAVDAVPEPVRKRMENIAFVIEDDPRAAKKTEHTIKSKGTLLGLYQGIPLPKRSAYYSGALPDKITIFKNSIEKIFGPEYKNIKNKTIEVVHHEIGHYLGMDEHTVRQWEKNRKK